MPDTVLHYVYDPLCGWCYAAASLVDAAARAGIALSLHGGGLWDAPTALSPDKARHIRESDARIASLTGQRFGAPYLDELLNDPATRFWSRPTVAAVLAAGQVEPGAEHRMLRAIQDAHYLAGRHVARDDVLTAVAAEIGLDAGRFAAAFDPDAATAHIARSRTLMDRLDLRGFPGFAVETGGGMLKLPHERFYGRPAAFVAAIEQVAPRRAA